jgi:hypothetical protein
MSVHSGTASSCKQQKPTLLLIGLQGYVAVQLLCHLALHVGEGNLFLPRTSPLLLHMSVSSC